MTADTTRDARLRSADLEVIKDGPGSAKPGQKIEYDITVRNLGEVTARRVVLTDLYPSEMRFLKASDKRCYASPWSSTVICNFPSLKVGESVSVTLTFRVRNIRPCTERVMKNIARVRASTHDPNKKNNESIVETVLDCSR